MRSLIDSHTFMWWCADHPVLSTRARAILRSPASEIYVSMATIWEIAIKVGLGRLEFEEDIEDAMQSYGFGALSITFAHIAQYRRLPLHHRDPFDRMLIAQAQCEGLTLLTCDRAIRRYDVPVAW
jgi:PIN domain nuclease of toxin-antitoxin system